MGGEPQSWMLRAAPGGAAADGIGLTVAACLLLWAAATMGTARASRTI